MAERHGQVLVTLELSSEAATAAARPRGQGRLEAGTWSCRRRRLLLPEIVCDVPDRSNCTVACSEFGEFDGATLKTALPVLRTQRGRAQSSQQRMPNAHAQGRSGQRHDSRRRVRLSARSATPDLTRAGCGGQMLEAPTSRALGMLQAGLPALACCLSYYADALG